MLSIIKEKVYTLYSFKALFIITIIKRSNLIFIINTRIGIYSIEKNNLQISCSNLINIMPNSHFSSYML